jgi:glutamate-1-semialdehyde 2,1-aminomutase
VRSLFKITGREDWKTLKNRVIPGGAHTYSKGDDQFPENAPPVLERGEGAWTYDVQGRRYLDLTMGLRSVSLGYGRKEVVDAVRESLSYGNNLCRPSIFEAKYAENLLAALKWPAMAKLAKNGSTATSAGVKLARAATGRTLVARCRQHAFFSYDDWFIGSTACPQGVPKEVSALTVFFDYDDLASVDRLVAEHPGKIACLILEPATDRVPSAGFLQGLRERCTKHGIVLIFDEMILGYRLALGGGTEYFGVTPDLATFGKGMANGFSMAALVGKREIMELGDITPGRRKVFLVSTTHGAEICSIAAAQATLNVYQEQPVIASIARFGAALKKGFNELAREHGLSDNLRMEAFDASPLMLTLVDGKHDPALRTLMLQEFIKQGVLVPYIAPSYSHGDAELSYFLGAFSKVAPVLAEAVKSGKLRERVVGELVKPVFREIN